MWTTTDYFRVMWWGKWIIIGVFLVAVAAALFISLRTPCQYETQAVVRLNPLPDIAGTTLQAPSSQMLLVTLTSDELAARTVEEAGLAKENAFQGLSQAELIAWLKGHIQGSILEGTSLVKLTLSGPQDPQLLRKILTTHIQVLGQWGAEDVSTQAKHEITGISTEEGVLTTQRGSLVQEIEGKIADSVSILHGQRDYLLKQLDAITGDKQNLQLPAGEQNGTLQGIILRNQFDALNTRLQVVEQKLDELKMKGRQEFPALRSRILDLDRQIQTLEIAAQETRRTLLSGYWQGLDVVSGPSQPLTPIGSHRKVTVAVAGVLGLFVGILLAFFVHYLLSAWRPESKRPDPGAASVEGR